MTCWLCGFETTELATNPKVPTCKNGPCSICTAVANTDEEINQVVATLRQLLAKRCDLRSEQNRVHGTLIRFPTELKSYIFEYLVPRRTEWGEPLPSFEEPILPYISICRDWRDTAWSNPQLWSTIHIPLGKAFSSSDPSSSFNFVHDWILRSRSLPLTLHIANKRGSLEDESKGVIDAITQCSNRLHSLSFIATPELLNALHHSNSQCHLLRCLRITHSWRRNIPPLSNPTMSPEKIEIHGVPFQSLQISWNQLSSAIISRVGAEDLVQLFQHASQMTYCHISNINVDGNFRISPITHHRLKELCISRAAETFLETLTLPCLQEFHADDFSHLEYLSRLVHRSSCPLGRITFNLVPGREDDWLFDDLQPLPGVTDLVLEHLEEHHHPVTVEKLLLEGYFPDLRYLTLRLDVFYFLRDAGVISRLLDRKRPHVGDTATKGINCKIFVVDRQGALSMQWRQLIRGQLKTLQLDVCWTEDGFEIFIPEYDRGSGRLPIAP